MSDLPDYDRWLARYRHHRTVAYCQDPECPNADGLPVEYHEEYGQGWIEPEDCPDCGEALGNEPPQEPDEDDEDDAAEIAQVREWNRIISEIPPLHDDDPRDSLPAGGNTTDSPKEG